VTIDGICYDLIEDGLKATVVVNTIAKYRGNISIPSSVSYEEKTYQVTAIGSSAFETCYSLNSVSIPSSVTSIGKNAFQYCSSLTSITIPGSVTSIGKNAFWSCENLTSVSIPNSVTSIGSYSFQYCDKLSTVKVEWEVPVSISSDVFSNNANMMLNVPLGTKEAYAAASYWQDFNIVEGDIYQGVTIDGICYDLIEDGLKATVVANTIAKYRGNISIPSSVSYEGKTYQVTAIGSSAFKTCYSLNSVSIPSSVTSIGNSAFYYCSSLTSITIPGSVTSIGDDAFSGCI
jgi:predicted MarR family transcription regulator